MKHKVISKYGVTKYVIRSDKGQQLDEVAVQALRSRQVSGLLAVEVHQKRKDLQLIYDVTGFTTFAAFLRKPMTKATFVNIIRGILNVFTVVQDNHLEIGKVNFDMDSIFVNPATSALFFIYIPIQNYNKDIRLKDILMSIPSHCVFSAAENREYVARFLQFMNTQISLSKVELAALLNSLEGDTGSVSQANVNVPLKQTGVQHEGSNSQTYDPFGEDMFDRSSLGKTGQGSILQESIHMDDFEEQAVRPMKINATSVLGESMSYSGGEGTTMLGEQHFPYIVRQYTGEKIMINCSPFRIGKDRNQCNYYVQDNSAVSRNHADIMIENGKYFIRDNGSTNFTYVNGRRIEQKVKCEIENDTQLRLANEDFTFYETEGEML